MSIVANLVEQATTSTGTGNLTLSAVDARQTFAGAIGTGSSNTFPYIIMHKSADEWERGTGYMSDSTTPDQRTNRGGSFHFRRAHPLGTLRHLGLSNS